MGGLASWYQMRPDGGRRVPPSTRTPAPLKRLQKQTASLGFPHPTHKGAVPDTVRLVLHDDEHFEDACDDLIALWRDACDWSNGIDFKRTSNAQMGYGHKIVVVDRGELSFEVIFWEGKIQFIYPKGYGSTGR